MIFDNKELMDLIESCRKEGKVNIEDIEKYIEIDSDDFDELARYLEQENIAIKSNEDEDDLEDENEEDDEDIDIDLDEEAEDFEGFIGDIENDPDFAEFSNEIENEIKNKDIDDLVGPSTAFYADDPVKMYLKEIGQIPLLNSNQEVELSRSVQEGLLAKEALAQVEAGKKTVTEDEMERIENAIAEGDEAFNVLTESNLRLVVSIAKKFLGKGMQFQDLIQEGNMGLMKAVKKFDPTKGYKFSTYATWWIKQAITRAIADQARTIRIPVHMVETINKMIRFQRKLTQELKREPTPKEIADEMGISPEKVMQIQKVAQEPVSLETPVGEEDDSTLSDFVYDTDTLNPLDYTRNEKFKEEINNFLHELNPKEERIIRLRYGLVDGRTRTLEEVGKEFNVTRERIRQIEAKALKKLKGPAKKRILLCLKSYLND